MCGGVGGVFGGVGAGVGVCGVGGGCGVGGDVWEGGKKDNRFRIQKLEGVPTIKKKRPPF